MRNTLQRETGIATILVAAVMSAFSVLALTVLTNAELRVRMTETTNDLHVVLYKADTGFQSLASRLNIPIAADPSGTERSGVALDIPIPQDAAVGASDAPWSHIVHLSPRLTVCCESGEGSCGNIDVSQPPYTGSVNRDVKQIDGSHTGQVQFELKPVTIDDVIALQLPSSYETGTASLLKATRVPEGSEAGSTAVSCRLQMDGKTVATGLLRVSPTTVASDVAGYGPHPTIAGTLHLQFGAAGPSSR